MRSTSSTIRQLPGDKVEVFIPGVSTPIATVTIIGTMSRTSVYVANVPGDITGTPAKEGAVEGETLTFKINNRMVARGCGRRHECRVEYPPAAGPAWRAIYRYRGRGDQLHRVSQRLGFGCDHLSMGLGQRRHV